MHFYGSVAVLSLLNQDATVKEPFVQPANTQ